MFALSRGTYIICPIMAQTSASNQIAVAELRELPMSHELARAVAMVVLERAEPPRSTWGIGEGHVARALQDAGIDPGSLEPRQTASLEAIDRGPKDEREAALASALVALGIRARLEAAGTPEARRQVIEGFIDKLDWIEASSPLAPYSALAAALGESLGSVFWKTVVSTLGRDARADRSAGSSRPGFLLVTRASALAHAPAAMRPQLTASVLSQVTHDTLRRVALAALAGDGGAPGGASEPDEPTERRDSGAPRSPRLEGHLVGRSWGLLPRLIAAVTGVLLLRWLIRLAGRFLLGLRHEGSIELKPQSIILDGTLRLLGRTIREEHAAHPLATLREASIARRFRYLHMLVGALALVIGAALGVNFLVEGACAGYPPLALFGLAVIGGGILLDVLLEVLVPNRKGVCSVALDFGPRRTFQLRGVDRKAAERFVEEVARLVPPPRGSSPEKSG